MIPLLLFLILLALAPLLMSGMTVDAIANTTVITALVAGIDLLLALGGGSRSPSRPSTNDDDASSVPPADPS